MHKRIVQFFFATVVLLASCKEGENNRSAPESAAMDSLSMLRSLVHKYPDSLLVRASLSGWLERHKGLDSALQPIIEGMKQDSTEPFLFNRKAMLLLAKGDTANAIRDLLKSLNLRPEQTDVHLELGFLYAAQKNKNALVVSDFLLSQAQEIPLQSQARFMKGIYYANIGRKQEALIAFNEVIINDYTFLDAYLEKGILLYNDKRYADALKTFDKAIAISNTHAESYLWAAKCLEAMGRKNEALDFYKKTVGFNAGLTEAEEAVQRLGK